MKKYIRYIMIIFVVLLFILSTQNMASTSEGYEINSYNVKINLNEDNTFNVEETITVNFLEETEEIAITILKRNNIIKEDGSKVTKTIQVTDIETSEPCIQSDSLNKMVLKFENKEDKFLGNKTYVIKYTCDIGKDPFKNKDQFYFNIFGNDTNAVIHNATFEIVMPKEIDENNIDMYTKLDQKMDSDNIVFSVEDKKVINGYYNGNLEPKEVLSVKISLPEGYFVVNNSQEIIVTIICVSISIIGVLICYLLWRKYGDDDPIVKVKTVNPPRGYNSAELGFFYKGEAEPDDIMTLLVGLANKGYLKIQEKHETTLFVKEKSFNIVKLKDYDGNDEIERIFFEGLFRDKTEVDESELNKRFFLTVERLEKRLESKNNIRKIFEETGASKGKIVLLIGILVLILTFLIPTVILYGLFGVVISTAFIIFECIGFSALKSISEYDLKKASGIVLAVILFSIFVFFMSTPIIMAMKMFNYLLGYKISYFVGLISFAIILFIRYFMAKRTKFGTEILGEIEGFKEYLETVDKKELKEKIAENKSYVYDVLSYTYILGISDKWIKKLEEFGIDKPDWFEEENKFSFQNLNDIIEDTMNPSITMDKSYKGLSSKGNSASGKGLK